MFDGAAFGGGGKGLGAFGGVLGSVGGAADLGKDECQGPGSVGRAADQVHGGGDPLSLAGRSGGLKDGGVQRVEQEYEQSAAAIGRGCGLADVLEYGPERILLEELN